MTFLIVGLYVTVCCYQAIRTLRSAYNEPTSSKAATTYEYKGQTFADQASLMAAIREDKSTVWFDWIFVVPESLILLVASMSGGMFGGAAGILIRLPNPRYKVGNQKTLIYPIIGLSMGALLYFFSLALPAIFTTGSNPIRPESAIVFAMSGGLFSDQAYKWLRTQVSRLVFNTKSDDDKD
jgi:hypothetical protein